MMGTYWEIFCLSFVLLLWLTGVFEAFNSLSGGRIRKVEAKDEVFAENLENWMENAISDEVMNRQGWTADKYGRVKENGIQIYKAGYVTAIQKILNKI